MTQTQALCSTPIQLLALLRGQLSTPQERDLQAHLDACESCRIRLENTAASADAWKEAQEFLGSTAHREFIEDSSVGHANREPLQIQQVLDSLGPTDDPESLGRIGGYEVSGVVGSGGMGIVLKAHDRSLDRIVAIKVMAPHLASSGSARKRFAREAKAAAAVLHPNVIAIHSVASDDACPYLVMPYVRGASLQKRIDSQGPLPLKDALRIGSQIASGLAAAHEQGLVHRDIKPANILLEEGVERVTITDFGLARAVDDASMTCSGVIAGTPQYMSPEQTRGEAIDARSDLFSLGSVMYAMCAGRSPFRAETTYGVLHRIANDNPTPICDVNSDVPVWLSHIIERLMAKRQDDRFDSAAQVAELLEDCLAHVQQPTTMPLPASIATWDDSNNVLCKRNNSVWAQALRFVTPDGLRRTANNSRPPFGKFIAAAAGGFVLLFLGVLIVLELNKGTLTIQSEADDIPIRIMQGDKVVERFTISMKDKTFRIAAGKYVVVIDGETDGIVVNDGGIIELKRGRTETVRITWSDRDRIPDPLPEKQMQPVIQRTADALVTINPDVPADGNPVDKAKLLNELRERDRKFSRHSVELERTWDTLTSPRGQASQNRHNSIRFGQDDPGIPEGLPKTYQQPHRIRYIWTGQNFESTLEVLADLETAIHPDHGKLASRTIESDGFNYHRFWDRDQEIFSHSSDIALLCKGEKAWEFLLPSGFGFTPSVLSVSNAVEVDDGYVLKGLISLPSATIGNRKNCFELHLDKELILRKALIQYHVYDFVIVTSGRSEFPGMPPLAKLAAVSIHHIGQDEKRSGDVGNYKYEVVSLSERLSKDEYDLRVNFAIPKGTKLATGLNLVEVNLQGLPGVTQIERDQPARRPEMTLNEQPQGIDASDEERKRFLKANPNSEKAAESDTLGQSDFRKLIPESGTALVMFNDGSENSRQMLPVAKHVAAAASVTFIEQPQAVGRPAVVGQRNGDGGPQFVLIKDRQQVGTRMGLFTEKRLSDFVRTADDWLTPHSTGVAENSLVRIVCYINPGKDNIGSQHGRAYPLTTAVVAVHEDQALLFGPDSIAEYLDAGYACVAVVLGESGKQKLLPLDIVLVGPVKLLRRDKVEKESVATATITSGEGQTKEVPIELSGYTASATQPLDAYETGSAIYHIRGAYGLTSVQLADVDYLPQVDQPILSGSFRNDGRFQPIVDFGSSIQWQTQIVKSVDGGIYGGNVNGAELFDVICPALPAPLGITFSSDGRMIGKYGLGHPTEKDMTHTVFQPVATHSVLQAALEKIEDAGLKAALSATLQPHPLDKE